MTTTTLTGLLILAERDAVTAIGRAFESAVQFLGKSRTTVSSQMSRLNQRLGRSSSTRAVARCLVDGLIDAAPMRADFTLPPSSAVRPDDAPLADAA